VTWLYWFRFLFLGLLVLVAAGLASLAASRHA
jgi:hypothetical protein